MPATAKTIAAAIRQRWAELGFDTSIAPLYRSHNSLVGFGSTPEETEGAILPRAEFTVDGDEPTYHAIGFRVREAVVTIRVYADDADDLSGWLDDIEDAFDNSDQAGTNPVELDESRGCVMSVQFSGRELMGLDKNVFLGVVEFSAMWSKEFSIPT